MTDRVYDLHCHSTASDGALSPSELLQRAYDQGVTDLALTDHDTVAGLAEAGQVAADLGVRLIPGIELSTTYLSQCLHIVGLNIDPSHPVLLAGLHEQHAIRGQRAHKIADKLEKKGFTGAYQAVKAAAGDGEITRSHFADYLVGLGAVADQQAAFDRYLSKGKPAFVPTHWVDLADGIAWIRAAGGIAVLAHPLRYKLSFKWMNKALAAFKQAGGQGLEVVTSRASVDDIRLSLQLLQNHQLHASRGSDFHSPENQWVELGRLQPLPNGASGVWELWAG